MKTLGMLTILFSMVSYCFAVIYESKNEILQVKELLNFMKYIKNQIKYFNDPLCDIYKSFKTENRDINAFLQNLLTSDWDSAINQTKNLQIPNECQKILKEFGNKLGKNSYIGQMEICDYYINLFEQKVNAICTASTQKNKVSISLAIYAGFLLLIIMW